MANPVYYYDRVEFESLTGGLFDFVVGMVVTGRQLPITAGIPNGTLVRYVAETADTTIWEIGTGTYSSGTPTIIRTEVLSNSAGSTSKINFPENPTVWLDFSGPDAVWQKEDGGAVNLEHAAIGASAEVTADTVFLINEPSATESLQTIGANSLAVIEGTVTVGKAATNTGKVKFTGTTSGIVTVQPQDVAGTWTLKLPADDGNSGEFLRTDGSGVTSWAATTGAPGGSNTQVQYNNSGSFGGSANLTWVSPALTIGASGTTGQLKMVGATSGTVTIQAQDVAGTWTFKWPADDGTSGQFLQTDGNGVTSWATAGVSDGDKGDIVVTSSGTVWTIDTNVVSDAKFRQSVGLSVVGRSANSTGNVADIVAASDNTVLRRSGTAVGFGTIPPSAISNFTSGIVWVMDNAGAIIQTGVSGDLSIPFGCTINSVSMLADQTGSIVVDIWKDTYANYPPTIADKITASAPPTISSAVKSEDTTLTGWTTTITAGDTLRFQVDSVTAITRVTLTLKVTRT